MLSPQDEEFLKAVQDGLKISFGAKTGDLRELLRIVGELKMELRAVTEDMIVAVDARSTAAKERDGLKEELVHANLEIERLQDNIEAMEHYQHKSDCALHNGPALPVGPCDCKKNP